MITAGDGSVPLASVDDPFDFFRREVLRHLGESPFRHSRDGPREVTLGLSVLEEKPEEGAQGRHHQLGDFGAARAGVSQEETRDVVRGQFPDRDRPVPEAFDEETPDEGPVPGDRDRSQAAFFLEVVGILASERRQRGLVCRRLWRSNGAPLAQVFEEVTDGRRITSPETSFAPSSLQELVGDWLMQMGECQALPSEPPCEVAQQPQALSHGRVGHNPVSRG